MFVMHVTAYYIRISDLILDVFFFFKQKTAYEMRISDWSSDVCSSDLQLSLAIGRRGQNVRLASQLTGKAIDILTEDDASEKRQREFIERSEMFQKELDVAETLAQLLVAEGFGALAEVASVEADAIAGIEGFWLGSASGSVRGGQVG